MSYQDISGIKAGTDRIPAKGPAAKANSMPVTMATDQPPFTIIIQDASGNPIGTFERTNADGEAPKTDPTVLPTECYPKVFNGTTFDRLRGNTVGMYAVLKADTTGGWTPTHLISAATTNATTVKASAGQVGYIICSNLNASARYLKLYDKASAPTVGSDTPVFTEVLPGSTTGGGIALNIPAGIAFANGISFALTTGIADADTGAVSASEISVNIGYK